MNAYLDSLKRYAVLQGRSTRSQYWMFVLFAFIAAVVALIFDRVLGTTYGNDEGGGLILSIVYLVHVIPAIAVVVRRLHDIDRTGWWFWIGLLPVIGQIVLLVFACMPSAAGPNRFGPPVGSPAAAGFPHGSRDPAMSQALQPPALSSPAAAQSASIVSTFVTSVSTVEQLERLASLRASGAIDETEYKQLKGNVLNGARL